MPEGAAENYARATETNLRAAELSRSAAATWRLVTWLVVGCTVLGAVAYDLRKRRR